MRGVDLQLNPGESVALVGHNGAGKTTLMKLMLGLIRPSAGYVRVLGEDPVASASVRSRNGVGFLPETIAFNASMTGAEVITFFARLKGVPKAEGRDLLARVGLSDAAGQRVGTYSKGMRQRLGLAQALLGSPRVLLLDEPTTGLDPQLRQNFYAIVSDLRDAGRHRAAVLPRPDRAGGADRPRRDHGPGAPDRARQRVEAPLPRAAAGAHSDLG